MEMKLLYFMKKVQKTINMVFLFNDTVISKKKIKIIIIVSTRGKKRVLNYKIT